MKLQKMIVTKTSGERDLFENPSLLEILRTGHQRIHTSENELKMMDEQS
jgi:hypothetical protein